MNTIPIDLPTILQGVVWAILLIAAWSIRFAIGTQVSRLDTLNVAITASITRIDAIASENNVLKAMFAAHGATDELRFSSIDHALVDIRNSIEHLSNQVMENMRATSHGKTI